VRVKLSGNEVFSLSSRREERAGERRGVGSAPMFPRNSSLQLSPHSFLAGREGSQSESADRHFKSHPPRGRTTRFLKSLPYIGKRNLTGRRGGRELIRRRQKQDEGTRCRWDIPQIASGPAAERRVPRPKCRPQFCHHPGRGRPGGAPAPDRAGARTAAATGVRTRLSSRIPMEWRCEKVSFRERHRIYAHDHSAVSIRSDGERTRPRVLWSAPSPTTPLARAVTLW